MGDSVSSFLEDTVDVLMTPFKTVAGIFTSTISDAGKASVDAIANAGDELGLDTLASDITSGIGSIGSTGLGVIDRGSDSLFGTLDVVKYVPYVIIGFVGIFGIKYGSEIISESGKSYRDRR